MFLSQASNERNNTRVCGHATHSLRARGLSNERFQAVTGTCKLLLPNVDGLTIHPEVSLGLGFALFVIELNDSQAFLSDFIGAKLAQTRQHLYPPPVVGHSTEDGKSVHRNSSLDTSVDTHVSS